MGWCVHRYSRAGLSKIFIWLGGAAAFLLGGLVTAAHEFAAEASPYADLPAHLREVHENAPAGHGSADFGLAREIADYLNVDRTSEPTAPPQRVAQLAASAKGQPSGYVGQQTCVSCHAQENANWAHTIHAKVFDLNPRNQLEM